MNKSHSVLNKHFRTFFTVLFSSVLAFAAACPTSADSRKFADDFEARSLGGLNGQGGWAVTNYYGNSRNKIDVSADESDQDGKFLEITNHDSVIATHDVGPLDAGIFRVRMRHNKSGLFYCYALTSDEGGQLLFSIQFTEANGILLEEGREQIVLLPDYVANKWYLFTVDFDKARGERGTFKIKIDNGKEREYEYVASESSLFDFAQVVFGSDGTGTAISAFDDVEVAAGQDTEPPAAEPAPPAADESHGFFADLFKNAADALLSIVAPEKEPPAEQEPVTQLPDNGNINENVNAPAPTLDIIDSGDGVQSTAPPAAAPAPIMEENTDGTDTLIAI